jgi:hypothetical protein
MKRDMDLIRRILLAVQDDQFAYGESIHFDDVGDVVCAHHVASIFDSGMGEGRLTKTDAHGIVAGSIDRLTSVGHDFCDAIRQDTIWRKATEHIIKPGASYGFSILVEWVKLEVHRRVFGDPPHS